MRKIISWLLNITGWILDARELLLILGGSNLVSIIIAFLNELPLWVQIVIWLSLAVVLFVVASYIWDAIKKRRLKRMKKERNDKDKERTILNGFRVKEDVDGVERVKGLEVENQDMELRDTSIDLKVRNAKEVTGASFKQTNKPALSSYVIICECGERIGRVFTGTPPSTIKCPRCGREHDVH
jgi:membrane protein implicated in regulation of membrane protease activity